MEVLFLVPSLKAPDFQARQSLKQFDAKELPLGVRCGCLKAGYSPKWPMGREHSDTPVDFQTPKLGLAENERKKPEMQWLILMFT